MRSLVTGANGFIGANLVASLISAGHNVVSYTLLATVALPQWWLDFYGPPLKNIPLIRAILVMLVLEDNR